MYYQVSTELKTTSYGYLFYGSYLTIGGGNLGRKLRVWVDESAGQQNDEQSEASHD